MSLPRYSQYKDSGADWLGELPEHWSAIKLKHLALRITDGAHVSPETEGGEFYFVSTKDVTDAGIDFSGALLTSPSSYRAMVAGGCNPLPGDVLFSKDGSIGKTVIVRKTLDFVVASSLIIIRPNPTRVIPEFLHYLCQSALITGQVESFVKGAGLPRLSLQNLLKVQALTPPPPEQACIATFLDREVAKIDALVQEQRRLVELLKEKRQAVISHTVTKGLNPHARMRDSGIEWLGKVPRHWEIKRIKYLISDLEQGWSPQCENFPAEKGEWAVLKVGCVNGGTFNPDENKALPADLPPIPELGIQAGDVLISRANTRELVGSAAVAASDFPRHLLCDKLYRLRLKNDLCIPEHLAMFLSTPHARGEIELAGTGASSSMVNIGQSTVTEMLMPVPTLEEQSGIASFIQRENGKINQLIAESSLAIDLLQERRTALISAAVTGKIDVCGLVEVSVA